MVHTVGAEPPFFDWHQDLGTSGMTLPACRIGDSDVSHCSPMVRMMGSPNVLVNFRPWSCQYDFNTPHLKFCKCPKCCCIHMAYISKGSRTVLVNFRGGGRITDMISKCTWVGQGSANVWAG